MAAVAALFGSVACGGGEHLRVAESPPPTGPTLSAPTTAATTTSSTAKQSATTTVTNRISRKAPAARTNASPSRSKASCAGWEALVAAHFPGEVAKGCSVLWCESRGDFTARNRTSSASGGWQFLDSTWRATTGRSDRAYQATPEAQTAAAAKLRQRSGWGQWQCK